jgi:hypothetical protein
VPADVRAGDGWAWFKVCWERANGNPLVSLTLSQSRSRSPVIRVWWFRHHPSMTGRIRDDQTHRRLIGDRHFTRVDKERYRSQRNVPPEAVGRSGVEEAVRAALVRDLERLVGSDVWWADVEQARKSARR